MKLISRHNKTEGHSADRDAVLAFGNNLELGSVEKIVDANFQMVATDRVWKKTGFFFKLELPINFTMSYLDPNTFTYKIGKCRYLLFFMRRTSPLTKKTHNLVIKGMFPIDPSDGVLDVARTEKEFGPEIHHFGPEVENTK